MTTESSGNNRGSEAPKTSSPRQRIEDATEGYTTRLLDEIRLFGEAHASQDELILVGPILQRVEELKAAAASEALRLARERLKHLHTEAYERMKDAHALGEVEMPFDFGQRVQAAESVRVLDDLLSSLLGPQVEEKKEDSAALAAVATDLGGAPARQACEDGRAMSYSPSHKVPRTTVMARCDLVAGHLGSHEGEAHGHRWFWNAHAYGILRTHHPTTNEPLPPNPLRVGCASVPVSGASAPTPERSAEKDIHKLDPPAAVSTETLPNGGVHRNNCAYLASEGYYDCDCEG